MPHGRPRRRKTKPILSEKFARKRLPFSYNSWLRFVVDHASVPAYTSKSPEAVYWVQSPNQAAITKLAQEDLQELIRIGILPPLVELMPTKSELVYIWTVLHETHAVWLLSPRQERIYSYLRQLYKCGLFLSLDYTLIDSKKVPDLIQSWLTIHKEAHANTTS